MARHQSGEVLQEAAMDNTNAVHKKQAENPGTAKKRVSFAHGPLEKYSTADGHPDQEGRTASKVRSVPMPPCEALTSRHISMLEQELEPICAPSIQRLKRRAGLAPLIKRDLPYAQPQNAQPSQPTSAPKHTQNPPTEQSKPATAAKADHKATKRPAEAVTEQLRAPDSDSEQTDEQQERSAKRRSTRKVQEGPVRAAAGAPAGVSEHAHRRDREDPATKQHSTRKGKGDPVPGAPAGVSAGTAGGPVQRTPEQQGLAQILQRSKQAVAGTMQGSRKQRAATNADTAEHAAAGSLRTAETAQDVGNTGVKSKVPAHTPATGSVRVGSLQAESKQGLDEQMQETQGLMQGKQGAAKQGSEQKMEGVGTRAAKKRLAESMAAILELGADASEEKQSAGKHTVQQRGAYAVQQRVQHAGQRNEQRTVQDYRSIRGKLQGDAVGTAGNGIAQGNTHGKGNLGSGKTAEGKTQAVMQGMADPHAKAVCAAHSSPVSFVLNTIIPDSQESLDGPLEGPAGAPARALPGPSGSNDAAGDPAGKAAVQRVQQGRHKADGNTAQQRDVRSALEHAITAAHGDAAANIDAASSGAQSEGVATGSGPNGASEGVVKRAAAFTRRAQKPRS